MKIKFLAKFILYALLIGFGMSFLIHQGLWFKLTSGFKAVPFYMIPLLFILMFYLTLSIHELTHLIAFKIKKIGILALYLTIFIFHKKEGKIKFTVKPKLWILFGGMVVPDLGEVTDDESYEKTLKAFSFSLMAAPVATIIFAVISFITAMLIWVFSESFVVIGYALLSNVYIMILSFVYIWSSRLNNEQFYGDFVAHKKMLNEPIFQVIQMHQYVQFSNHNSEASEAYLFKKAVQLIKNKTFNYSLFDIMLMHIYLEGVTYGGFSKDLEIHQILTSLNSAALTKNEHGLQFAHDLAAYFYATGQARKAYQLYDQITKRPLRSSISKLQKSYLEHKSKHIMHIEYCEDYLNNNENLFIGHSWIFEVIADPYEELKKSHEPLPFIVYETPVELVEKEKSDQESL
jgi:hypothetical protein